MSSRSEAHSVLIVRVDVDTYSRHYAESGRAIRDFLYMLFAIAGDRLPLGDWDRAELGETDPFAFLDIRYEYQYQVRSEQELGFLHRSAALNLLCRLAVIQDSDDCSGSSWMEDFRSVPVRIEKEALIREYHPDLFRILEAFESGRIVRHPTIQRAFRAALYGTEDFLDTLMLVTSEVVLRTFDFDRLSLQSRM